MSTSERSCQQAIVHSPTSSGRKEFELRLAADLCPRGCGAPHVMGFYASRRARRDDGNYVRRFSVDSYLGGYGLYYRSPLVDMNVIAPAGSQLGDESTPVDVLRRDERAHPAEDSQPCDSQTDSQRSRNTRSRRGAGGSSARAQEELHA
jgi:hypothetical protein